MRILSWNVAGLRARLRKDELEYLRTEEPDVIALQETKATAEQAVLPDWIKERYAHRFWRNTDGSTQRKGLSGTAIWVRPGVGLVGEMEPPDWDREGRITVVEFATSIVVCVYTPNSQNPISERHRYRIETWDPLFRAYLQDLGRGGKSVIVCGDFNVALEDRDVYAPDKFRNESAGFLDAERSNFQMLLDKGWVDAFRFREAAGDETPAAPYTYWDQKIPALRKHNKGWRIDYFLVPREMQGRIRACTLRQATAGSDHCPILLDFDTRRVLRVAE